MRSHLRLVAPLVTAAALCACTGDSSVTSTSSEASGFSFARAILQLPAELPGENVQIVLGDLDSALAYAGLERRPTDGDVTLDDVESWLIPLSGVSREGVRPVGLPLPIATQPGSATLIDEFDDELGWSVADVSWFVELQAMPNVFTVMGGSFSEVRIGAALGARDGAIWRVGGDDFESQLDERSAARPIGEALRLALVGDVLVVGRATVPVERWAEGDVEPFATDAMVEVATALDDAGDVYGALILAGDGRPSDAYDVLGVGVGGDDASATATFVYHFADPGDAASAAELVEGLLRDGASARTAVPWSELVSVVSVVADGPLLTVRLELIDLLPLSVFITVYAHDNLVSFDLET